MAVRVVLADVVGDRVDPGETDGDIGLAFPPRAAKRVIDDHGWRPCRVPQGGQQPSGRGVGVGRAHDGATCRSARRLVDAAVGAHETVVSLGDEQWSAHPHDSPRLAKNDFDEAWILVPTRGEVGGERRRLDIGKLDDGAFGLGHDLDVTTTTSRSTSDTLPAMRAARSSPAAISGRPPTSTMRTSPSGDILRFYYRGSVNGDRFAAAELAP